MITEQFQNLSADQLRLLVKALPMLEQLREALYADIKKKDSARRADILPKGVYWAPLYELPIEAHFGSFLKATGLDTFVRNASASGDPTKAITDELANDMSGQPTVEVQPAEGVTKDHIFGLVMSIDRSLESLVVWGRYLNELVAEAREGKSESLFKAIKIDPSVTGCPSVSSRISRAVALRDQVFQKKLRAALAGRTKNQAHYLRKVRFIMQALREAGIERMGDKKLVRLFSEMLDAYQVTDQGSAERALRKHWAASKRKSAT